MTTMLHRTISIGIFIATVALVWPATAWAAEEKPEIIVEMDRNTIYEGQSILYRVTLNNVQKPTAPDLSGFDDFLVTPLGEQSLNFQSVININGRTSVVTRRGRQYNYRLTPKRAGNLTIPAPTAEVDGRQLRGREMSLLVKSPDQQDAVRMEITVEPESVYPMQPFTVTLSIAVKALPEPYTDDNPVAVQTSPPELEIPWVEDERLPDGLESKQDWRRWLGPLESSRGAGFAVNNIGNDSVFSIFENRRTAFLPGSEKIRLPDKSGKMSDYWRFQFKRTFIATRVGQYSFGPVTLNGIFATGLDPVKGALSEKIYAVAKTLSVNIKDVPEEGRPDNYIGAIGRFQFSADLAPHKAKTGDPMTLTLTLSGQGTLDSVTAPDLTKIPQIADKFKIYEATEQTKGNEKQFTYGLRPLESGIKEFPPVAVSYFDVQDEKYVTVSSAPIPLEIKKADRLASREISGATNSSGLGHRELEMRQEGIFANITDLGELSNESIRPERWLAALGALGGLYAVMAFATVRVRRLSNDTARRRRRVAPGKARAVLNEAIQDLKAGRVREGADRLESALVGLVADWNNLPAAGMTSAEACRQLQSLGIDGEALNRINRLIEKCESIHYGATLQAGEALRSEAKPALEAAIGALKRAGIRGEARKARR
jgi:hypothetical protein